MFLNYRYFCGIIYYIVMLINSEFRYCGVYNSSIDHHQQPVHQYLDI